MGLVHSDCSCYPLYSLRHPQGSRGPTTTLQEKPILCSPAVHAAQALGLPENALHACNAVRILDGEDLELWVGG